MSRESEPAGAAAHPPRLAAPHVRAPALLLQGPVYMHGSGSPDHVPGPPSTAHNIDHSEVTPSGRGPSPATQSAQSTVPFYGRGPNSAYLPPFGSPYGTPAGTQSPNVAQAPQVDPPRIDGSGCNETGVYGCDAGDEGPYWRYLHTLPVKEQDAKICGVFGQFPANRRPPNRLEKERCLQRLTKFPIHGVIQIASQRARLDTFQAMGFDMRDEPFRRGRHKFRFQRLRCASSLRSFLGKGRIEKAQSGNVILDSVKSGKCGEAVLFHRPDHSLCDGRIIRLG